MTGCTPAHDVYDHVRSSLNCLPMTGHPLLPVVLLGLFLLSLGLMVAGLRLVLNARDAAEAAARDRFHPRRVGR